RRRLRQLVFESSGYARSRGTTEAAIWNCGFAGSGSRTADADQCLGSRAGGRAVGPIRRIHRQGSRLYATPLVVLGLAAYAVERSMTAQTRALACVCVVIDRCDCGIARISRRNA